MIRSKQYPFKNLEWCINALANVTKDYTVFTDKQLAPYLNNQNNDSIDSGDFKKKLGALNHFKLLNKNIDTYTLTEETLILIFNNSDEKFKTLKKIALTPNTFQDAYEHFTSIKTLNKDDIQNIAINKLGITPRSYSKFEKNLIETFLYAGLIEKSGDNKYLVINTDKLSILPNDNDIVASTTVNTENNIIKNDLNQYLEIPFLLENSQVIQVSIPNPSLMNNIDKNRLIQLIKMYTNEIEII